MSPAANLLNLRDGTSKGVPFDRRADFVLRELSDERIVAVGLASDRRTFVVIDFANSDAHSFSLPGTNGGLEILPDVGNGLVEAIGWGQKPSLIQLFGPPPGSK